MGKSVGGATRFSTGRAQEMQKGQYSVLSTRYSVLRWQFYWNGNGELFTTEDTEGHRGTAKKLPRDEMRPGLRGFEPGE